MLGLTPPIGRYCVLWFYPFIIFQKYIHTSKGILAFKLQISFLLKWCEILNHPILGSKIHPYWHFVSLWCDFLGLVCVNIIRFSHGFPNCVYTSKGYLFASQIMWDMTIYRHDLFRLTFYFFERRKKKKKMGHKLVI